MRTTSKKHIKVVQRLWAQYVEQGDIFLDVYKGWYNVREENFVTETDAAADDYKDPVSGKPLMQMEEESYFFRLSRFQEPLIAHFEAHPEFVQPAERHAGGRQNPSTSVP